MLRLSRFKFSNFYAWFGVWRGYCIRSVKGEKWLSQIVKKEMKVQQKLIEQFWARWGKIKYLFKSDTSWRWIVPIIAGLFGLCYWSFMPTIVIISRLEALDILEKRLTNFITLFGTSITVAVFIVNIIKGRQNGEGYNTVLVEAGFYPVLYSALTTIGFLALVSSYRNIFGNVSWLSDDIIIRITFLGVWLFAILLISLGWLFLRLYRFLNTDELRIRRIARIRSLAYAEMLKEIRQRRSLDVYRKFLQRLGFRESSSWVNNPTTNTIVTLSDAPPLLGSQYQSQSLVLQNINLAGIEKVSLRSIIPLQKESQNTFQAVYVGVSLGMAGFTQETRLFSLIQSFLHTAEPTPNAHIRDSHTQIARILAKQFKMVIDDEHLNEYKIELRILHDDLMKAVSEGNIISLKPILRMYQEIYRAAGELYRNFNIANNREKFPSSIEWLDTWESVEYCIRSMVDAISTAYTKNQLDAFDTLNYHIAYVLVDATENSFWVFFQQYSALFSRSYFYLSEMSSKDNSVLKQPFHIVRNLGLIIRRHILDVLDKKFSLLLRDEAEVKERFNVRYHVTYTLLSNLMKQTIDRDDDNNFRALLVSFQNNYHIESDYTYTLHEKIEELKRYPLDEKTIQQIEHYKRQEKAALQPHIYKNYAVFVVFTWIFFRYSKGKISFEQLRKFIPDNFFQTNRVIFDDPFYSWFYNSNHMGTYLFLNEILAFIGQSEEIFSIKNWSLPEDEHLSTRISTRYWLYVGTVLGLINRKDLKEPRIELVEDCKEIWNTHHYVPDICNNISSNSEEWAIVFNVIDKIEIEHRCHLIIELFKKLEQRSKTSLENRILETPIDTVRIENSRQLIYERYHENCYKQSSLPFWSKYFNAKTSADLISDANAHIIYHNNVIQDIRKSYVNVELPYGSSSASDIVAGSIGDYSQNINDKFILTLLATVTPRIIHNKGQGIIDAITELRTKGYFPNLVLYTGMHSGLWFDTRFTQTNNQETYQRICHRFENIPIAAVLVQETYWQNKIVVCDFAKAFRMLEQTNNDWHEKHLNIQIEGITDVQAREIIQQDLIGSISEEEIEARVRYLRLGMTVMIEEYARFEILDKEAFILLECIEI